MDNNELSSLDFRFLAQELNSRLNGGIFRTIYQFGRKQLAFEIYVPRRATSVAGPSGEQVLYADNKRMFMASERMEAPEEPPNFCMFLRKHLMGREIRDIRQHGFDRIIEVETDENILIFEFVPPGNIILCDKFYNIIMPLEVQRWKHREVKPKDSYAFPPSQADLTKMEIWDFFQEISKSDGAALDALSRLGLGRTYAADACSRAGIRHDKPASKVTVDEATGLFNVLKAVLNSRPEPCIYKDMVSAFPLESRKAGYKHAAGLSDALDVFFSKEIEEEKKVSIHAEEEKAAKEEAERVERIEQAREEAKELLAERKVEKFTKAQLIYRNYILVSNILDGLRRARDGGFTWQQIRERLASSLSHEAKAIREIRENEGIIVVDLEGNSVELDIRKTPEENAGLMFEGAKKLRKKIERIEALPPPEPKLPAPEPKTMDKIVEEVQATLAGAKIPAAKERKPKAEPEKAAPAPYPEPVAYETLIKPAPEPAAQPPAPVSEPEPITEKPKSKRRRLQELVSGKEVIALPAPEPAKPPELAGETSRSVSKVMAQPETCAEPRESGTTISVSPLRRRVPSTRKQRRKWYETYRWFISSEGNIVIAGKNAVQNESAIKSRFKDGDLAFHADVHGAAFVVAKADEPGSIGPLTIKEAAEFAAAYSKAWAAGFGEVDVLQFKPGALSKNSPDGAKLTKGSYYGRPSQVHDKVEVRLSIGVQATEFGASTIVRVYAGPLMPVRKSCKYFVTIQPGGTPAQELAQDVKNGILARCMPEHRRAIEALPLDEFARHVPGGAGSLVG